MKTLFITGANNGIGYHMAKRWLENGENAAVMDLNCDYIDTLKEYYPSTLVTFQSDVCNKDSVYKAIDLTFRHFGSIDYAVHNACLCLFKSFNNHRREDFHRVMDVNFYGAVNLAEAVIPIMKVQKLGKVCFTSSGVGVTGYFNISSYASSKGALESFAK
jgi:NADP-dependent 3-hydroxy acid dehydrogenase YdfG